MSAITDTEAAVVALALALEQIVNAIVSVGAAWWLCQMALNAAKSAAI